MSHPHNYKKILKEFPNLRLCLAHYGDASNWERQLKGRPEVVKPLTWVKCISDMISSGEFPNLYTDIAMTLFFPKPTGLYFDFYDYLKVLLSNPHIREHVLYGSDYYMAETAPLSEKQVAISLRSRLGEELFFQIAHMNPENYLGISEQVD
jgi:predicted TIM-barrel fold metal-dependent hydrolase